MTAIAPPTHTASRVRMSSDRKHALVAGIFYLVTFVSIPTLGLYAAITRPDYLASGGSDAAAQLGALLEIVVALANIGTAVALFPVLKRHSEGMALGFVAARIFEAGTIFAGVAALLAIVTLHRSGVGAEGQVTAQALASLHEWLRLGQTLMPAVNAVALGSVLYRARLVPRILPIVAFIGAPLLVASTIATVLGLWNQESAISGLLAFPDVIWEFALGVYLIARGLRSTVPHAGQTKLVQ